MPHINYILSAAASFSQKLFGVHHSFKTACIIMAANMQSTRIIENVTQTSLDMLQSEKITLFCHNIDKLKIMFVHLFHKVSVVGIGLKQFVREYDV